MGLRDQVAKLEKEKEQRQEEKMEKAKAKLAPREQFAQSIHDALAQESDYLKEEGFELSLSKANVRLDHALGHILILCDDDRANVCLFLREEEGSKDFFPHKNGNEFVKTVDEAEEAVAKRLSDMRDVTVELERAKQS